MTSKNAPAERSERTSGTVSQTCDSPASRYKYVVLVASVLMQLCLGMTYSWSLFVKPLRELLGISQASAQLPFMLFYVAFPLTAMFAGGLVGKRGPRFCAVIGGLVFGTGWILASQGIHNYACTVVGIGLLGGIGVGFAYLVPIATCMQWFPDRKGMVTGIAVAGFGGGSALVAKVAGYCMAKLGMGPFDVLRDLGAVALVLVCVAGAFVRRPAGSAPRTDSANPFRQVISDNVFRLLYFAMVAGLAAGLAFNGNLKELGPTNAAASGVTAIALFAIGNAVGRLVWGMLADKFRVISMIRLNLLLQALVLLTVAALIRMHGGLSGRAFVELACLAGFNYGGVLVLYASATAQRYGPEHVGRVYGWMFSSNVPASFAPMLAGLAYDRTGSFAFPFAGIAVVAFVAAALLGGPGRDMVSMCRKG